VADKVTTSSTAKQPQPEPVKPGGPIDYRTCDEKTYRAAVRRLQINDTTSLEGRALRAILYKP
jgi:hypothetical protein